MVDIFGESKVTVKNSDGDVVRSFSGTPVTVELLSKPLDLGAKDLLKYIDVVISEIFDAESIDNLTFEVGYQNRLDENINWTSFTPNVNYDPMFLRITGRYIRFRLRSSAPDVFWRLSAIDFYGSTHGRRF